MVCKVSGLFPANLETCQTFQDISLICRPDRENLHTMIASEFSEIFPDFLRNLLVILDISGHSGKPEILNICLKTSILAGNPPFLLENFTDKPESFQTIWKVFQQAGMLPD